MVLVEESDGQVEPDLRRTGKEEVKEELILFQREPSLLLRTLSKFSKLI